MGQRQNNRDDLNDIAVLVAKLNIQVLTKFSKLMIKLYHQWIRRPCNDV
jgi:hypothetical protein